MRYLDALAFVQLLGEFAPSTASASSLRTHNRREPQDGSGQLILVMVSLDQKLLHPFGGGIDVLWPAGMIFVPYGPPTCRLMGNTTDGTGMPTSKGWEVEVEPIV